MRLGVEEERQPADERGEAGEMRDFDEGFDPDPTLQLHREGQQQSQDIVAEEGTTFCLTSRFVKPL